MFSNLVIFLSDIGLKAKALLIWACISLVLGMLDIKDILCPSKETDEDDKKEKDDTKKKEVELTNNSVYPIPGSNAVIYIMANG